jgi:hypothetical protein
VHSCRDSKQQKWDAAYKIKEPPVIRCIFSGWSVKLVVTLLARYHPEGEPAAAAAGLKQHVGLLQLLASPQTVSYLSQPCEDASAGAVSDCAESCALPKVGHRTCFNCCYVTACTNTMPH